MAVRLLFAFADNEGHLPSMRYLVLSPFPPSNDDHVDPVWAKDALLPIRAGSSTLCRLIATGSARRQANPHGTPKTTFVPGWAASTRARRPILPRDELQTAQA